MVFFDLTVGEMERSPISIFSTRMYIVCKLKAFFSAVDIFNSRVNGRSVFQAIIIHLYISTNSECSAQIHNKKRQKPL